MKYCVNRDIYPEERYPYAQWNYQFLYERDFDKITAWDDQDPEGLLKLLYREGDPAQYLKPAITADAMKDGAGLVAYRHRRQQVLRRGKRLQWTRSSWLN